MQENSEKKPYKYKIKPIIEYNHFGPNDAYWLDNVLFFVGEEVDTCMGRVTIKQFLMDYIVSYTFPDGRIGSSDIRKLGFRKIK